MKRSPGVRFLLDIELAVAGYAQPDECGALDDSQNESWDS
jgi:hypothetical protein